MNGTAVEKSVSWHTMLSELLVFTLLNFLAWANDGPSPLFSYSSTLASSLSSILIPIPLRVALVIHQMGFITVVSRTGFDLHLSYIAFNRSFEVDWSSATTFHVFFLRMKECKCFRHFWAASVNKASSRWGTGSQRCCSWGHSPLFSCWCSQRLITLTRLFGHFKVFASVWVYQSLSRGGSVQSNPCWRPLDAERSERSVYSCFVFSNTDILAQHRSSCSFSGITTPTSVYGVINIAVSIVHNASEKRSASS